jgi:hypothetical protein
MGYYTQHTLSIEQGPGNVDDFEQEILDTFPGAQFNDVCKWYDMESEMKEFSIKYPNTVFLVHGEGEGSGDLWDCYFKNGKVQMCGATIVYDPYNEDKLQ